jgi:hypothetical protein
VGLFKKPSAGALLTGLKVRSCFRETGFCFGSKKGSDVLRLGRVSGNSQCARYAHSFTVRDVCAGGEVRVRGNGWVLTDLTTAARAFAAASIFLRPAAMMERALLIALIKLPAGFWQLG